MRRIGFLLVAVAMGTSVVAYMAPASGQADGQGAPRFVTKIPSGYRNWRLISVAHEEGDLNSFGAILGNDIAIKAYREGKLPFPDGAIIKPGDAAFMKTCFPCHEQAKARDLVFTRYYP